MWNHLMAKWSWVVPGTNVIIQDNLASLDASRCSVVGSGELLTINFNITPKTGFISPPFNHTKRIWLRTKNADLPVEGHVIPNNEVGSWVVVP